MRVYYNNDQTKLRRQIRTYQLHIHGKVKTDEVSVKVGEEHKLDVLSNANQVVHWTRNKTSWREVWSRSSGAQSDQLTVTDGTLSIKEFTANDAGTYRVLDCEGEILITVTVTGERSSVDILKLLIVSSSSTGDFLLSTVAFVCLIEHLCYSLSVCFERMCIEKS
uniref:Immunoglobulin subtype domain-containing protein n=1 Tax=Sinocyclocheilus grahami TaxID=75366 RepID=A0A672L7S3_SINGR